MEGPENSGFGASMCSTRGKHQASNEGCSKVSCRVMKRGMQDDLKAGAVQSRSSRAPAFLFFIFGVKNS